jgi:Zn-finger nucleic acid-binding protein
MKCPVCKSSDLVTTDLESNLTSSRCADCGGNWIQGAAYWKWLEEHGNLPEKEDEDEKLSLVEPEHYIDCPECRFRMVKYLVGRGLAFSLDHCQGCKGIWLDRNEWETLKKRNLHDDLNAMLTSFWQATARKEARKKKLEQIYVGKLGADNYEELKRIRQWLDSHPNKQYLLAYLTAADPFDL